MSKSLLLMLCVVTGVLVLACSSAPEANRNATAPSSASSPAASTPATTTASTATQVGVAECDNFITAYESCVTTKVPEVAREQFKNAVATWRTEWKKLADNPQTRGQLAAACKTQMETARAQMKAYNCTF